MLDMSDPYLEAEQQPPSIMALGNRLKSAYGVGADNFGCKGNSYHYNGFHRSRNYLLGPNGPGPDYSTSGSKNQGGDGDNCCAFDFTPGEWGTSDNRAKMIELTGRLRAAARANDPRLAAYYEFAGTEDGVHVVTFYAQGGQDKTPFDSSHLDHIHGSKYRSMSDHDDTGLGDVMLGKPLRRKEKFHMYVINDPDTHKGVTQVAVEGGAAAPNGGYLQITNDTGAYDPSGPSYALRIAAKPYGGSYVFINDTERTGGTIKDGVITLKNGETLSWKLPKDTRNVSIRREPVEGQTAAYTGPLSGTVEVL